VSGKYSLFPITPKLFLTTEKDACHGCPDWEDSVAVLMNKDIPKTNNRFMEQTSAQNVVFVLDQY